MAGMNILGPLRILREIRLGEIKAGAERRFALLIIGDAAAGAALAACLGPTANRTARHPWVTVLQATDFGGFEQWMQPDPHADKLALVVITAPDPRDNEVRALARLHEAGVPPAVVVMRDGADALPGAGLERPGEAARVLLPSSPDAKALQARLAPALIKITPPGSGLRLALARQFPVLRDPLVADEIEDVARANAVYAASTGIAEIAPVLTIPFAATDVLVLTKNQLVMSYKIALMAGKSGSVRDVMGEVIGVVGGGLLLRQIARELVGLIPVIGIVPKVAIAYAGTRVIGALVQAWAVHGRRVRRGEMRALYTDAVAGGRAVAHELLARVRPRIPHTTPEI